MELWYRPKCLDLGESTVSRGLNGQRVARAQAGRELPYRCRRLDGLGP